MEKQTQMMCTEDMAASSSRTAEDFFYIQFYFIFDVIHIVESSGLIRRSPKNAGPQGPSNRMGSSMIWGVEAGADISNFPSLFSYF